ncbi:MAG: regulatory protein ArsR [Myxococcaceae bacterium]|nr:regulatory protein ArsR [Myxococcaceae bacterium]
MRLNVSKASTCAPPSPSEDTPDRRPVEGKDADEELARLARALGHPARVQIVRNVLPLAQSTVSQHLKVLKEAGLIRGEIDGPRTCYCIEPRALRRLKALVGSL